MTSDLRPVVAFSTGIVDGAVAVQLEAAGTKGQLAMGEGDPFAFVLTAQGAIELGQALIERGELALRGDARADT